MKFQYIFALFFTNNFLVNEINIIPFTEIKHNTIKNNLAQYIILTKIIYMEKLYNFNFFSSLLAMTK